MKEIVNLSLKVVCGISFSFCVMVFAYSKSADVFMIVLGSSIVLLFILYSLLLLLKSALRGKINFIYLLLHSLAVVILILLSAFIFKFHNVRFVYFLWTLISYPLIFIVSYVVAYIYKTSSRK